MKPIFIPSNNETITTMTRSEFNAIYNNGIKVERETYFQGEEICRTEKRTGYITDKVVYGFHFSEKNLLEDGICQDFTICFYDAEEVDLVEFDEKKAAHAAKHIYAIKAYASEDFEVTEYGPVERRAKTFICNIVKI